MVFVYSRWPNTVFSHALADAIQRTHKDCKNKHAVDTAIILFAQCPLYLCYFLTARRRRAVLAGGSVFFFFF